MGDKNFHTFIDFGKNEIRACSFNKETEEIENQFLLTIKNNQSNDLLSEEELVEDLIFNLEKKNGEYLDEINLMIDNPNILFISLSIFKKRDGQLLDNDFLKYISDEAKYEINKNYPNYEIIHLIMKNFYLDEKRYFEFPKNLKPNKFAIEFNFFIYPKFFLDNFRKIFAKQNVIIKKFIFSSYSKSIFYLNKISYQNKIIFVDIGFEKIGAFLFENKKMKNFKILPIGGNHITKDISKILKIEVFKANEIKLNFNDINNDKKLSQDQIELIKKIIFSRTEELLNICSLLLKDSDDLNNVKLVFLGNGSKILDSKFKSNIIFDYDIDLLDENYVDICFSGLNLVNVEKEASFNKIDFNEKKKGFFEKFFNLFG
ncbi:cell division FtsA domain-containing protein [Candidatus Pelagibacter sp.]|jgi:cell division protein FtsA|nr:cell division FtsA domain-containing protein [Candidatus Pelagibacter sp.]